MTTLEGRGKVASVVGEMAPTTVEAETEKTVMATEKFHVAYVSERTQRAKLVKIAAALETELFARANDVTTYGGADAADVVRSSALGIEIVSTLDVVTIKEDSGLAISWLADGTTRIDGRSHSRGYDRVTNMTTDAMMSLA